MHHAPFAIPAAEFGRHVEKRLRLVVQVALRAVPAVLAPLARQDAPARRVRRERRDGVAGEREPLGIVKPGPAAAVGGHDLVQHWRIDHADDGVAADGEADGYADHREEVGEVDGAVERVDDPRRGVVNDIVLVRALGVCFFPDEPVFR